MSTSFGRGRLSRAVESLPAISTGRLRRIGGQQPTGLSYATSATVALKRQIASFARTADPRWIEQVNSTPMGSPNERRRLRICVLASAQLPAATPATSSVARDRGILEELGALAVVVLGMPGVSHQCWLIDHRIHPPKVQNES